MTPYLLTRRKALRNLAGTAACAGLGGMLGDLRLLHLASAQGSPPDYRALVCVFLGGGNDSTNFIVRRDPAGYAEYQTLRPGVALPSASLLPINTLDPDGRDYGFHPSCTRLQELYNGGKLAVLFNTGPLIVPLTKAQYQAGILPRPQQLFSHSDQIVTWHGATPLFPPPTGWGGRCADLAASVNPEAQMSLSVSVAGQTTFEVGVNVKQFQMSPSGVKSMLFQGDGPGPEYLSFQRIVRLPQPNLQVRVLGQTLDSAITVSGAIATAIAPTVPANFFTVPFPNTGLGEQLRMIARLIHARTALSMKRQIFFAKLEGFDTHSAQITAGNPLAGSHASLLTQFSEAVYAFQSAMEQLAISPNVTLSTASDFGRTFLSNGNLGTDHGWGGHHCIVGGSVRGQRTFGNFPALSSSGPDSAGHALLPTTSVSEYAATLGRWFLPATADLNAVFPNLANFPHPDLGFLNPVA